MIKKSFFYSNLYKKMFNKYCLNQNEESRSTFNSFSQSCLTVFQVTYLSIYISRYIYLAILSIQIYPSIQIYLSKSIYPNPSIYPNLYSYLYRFLYLCSNSNHLYLSKEVYISRYQDIM